MTAQPSPADAEEKRRGREARTRVASVAGRAVADQMIHWPSWLLDMGNPPFGNKGIC
jgi:hypothetical protein